MQRGDRIRHEEETGRRGHDQGTRRDRERERGEISGGTNKKNTGADNRKEATTQRLDTARGTLPRTNPSGGEPRETSPTATVSHSPPASNNNHPVQRQGAALLSHSVTGMKLQMLSAEIRVDAFATSLH